MGRAKEIVIKVIPASVANPFVRAHHYSGKVVNNSTLHFGAFLDGQLHGVMSFGPSMDKSKLIGLVEGTKWNEFIELNRMAFDDYLPRNSESYSIGKAIRLIRKNAPHIKWIVSFADGCSCGDGTIYRASNFVLTQIKPNSTILIFPNGEKIAELTLTADWDCRKARELAREFGVPHRYRTIREWKELGAVEAPGFMLRYIYFVDKSCRDKLTCPIIPFSEIDKYGAGMYRGGRSSREERHQSGVMWLEERNERKAEEGNRSGDIRESSEDTMHS